MENKALLFLTCIVSLLSFPALAHEHTTTSDHNAAPSTKNPEEVQVIVQQIGENIHLLQGQGGNIIVSSGNSGVIMIDADFAQVTPTILKAIKSFTNENIKYLINTHWHGDHTGGNENIGATGSTIISHDNVRPRLTVDNYIEAFDMKVPAQKELGLPSITFNDQISLFINGEDIRLTHIPNAHTDGDIIIYFPKSNIIHTGDLYFNGFYPFIDTSSGGTLTGIISGVDKILALANDQTKIVAGHGPLSNKAELKAYRDMLTAVEAKIKPMIEAGKTLEEIAATKPLDEFNSQWGDGFLPPEKWLGIAVGAMKPVAPTKPQ